MQNIPVRPSEILAYKIDREDVKRIAKSYAQFLGMYLLSLLSYIFVYALATRKLKDQSSLRLIYFIPIFITLLFAGCCIYYGRVIYRGRACYKKDIEKYGAQVLTNDLMKPENEVFYLDKDKSETYMIVSERFLYYSHTRIFAWEEIASVSIDPAYTPWVNKLNLNLANKPMEKPYDPKSKNPIEVVRFCKKTAIVFKNGKKEECMVALEEGPLMELVNILNIRSNGMNARLKIF